MNNTFRPMYPDEDRSSALTESDVERVVAAIGQLQPKYFRNITINFGHDERLYGMFVKQVAEIANKPQGKLTEGAGGESVSQPSLFETYLIVDTPPNAKGM